MNLNQPQCEAIVGAACVLLNDCADRTARELLSAFADAATVDRVVALCKDGYWRDAVPIFMRSTER